MQQTSGSATEVNAANLFCCKGMKQRGEQACQIAVDGQLMRRRRRPLSRANHLGQKRFRKMYGLHLVARRAANTFIEAFTEYQYNPGLVANHHFGGEMWRKPTRQTVGALSAGLTSLEKKS